MLDELRKEDQSNAYMFTLTQTIDDSGKRNTLRVSDTPEGGDVAEGGDDDGGAAD